MYDDCHTVVIYISILQSQCVCMMISHSGPINSAAMKIYFALQHGCVNTYIYMLADSNICVNMYLSACTLVIRGYNNGHTEGHLSPNGAKSSWPQDHPLMIFCIIGHHHCHK